MFYCLWTMCCILVTTSLLWSMLSVGTVEVSHADGSRSGSSQCTTIFPDFWLECHALFLYQLLGSAGLNWILRSIIQNCELPLADNTLCSRKEQVMRGQCPRKKPDDQCHYSINNPPHPKTQMCLICDTCHSWPSHAFFLKPTKTSLTVFSCLKTNKQKTNEKP